MPSAWDRAIGFTPEDLAELAAFDAEVDRSECTEYELFLADKRDRAVLAERRGGAEQQELPRHRPQRVAHPPGKAGRKAYYRANRTRIRQQKALWWVKNRDAIKRRDLQRSREELERRRALPEYAGRDSLLAEFRRGHGLTQTEAGRLIGVSPSAIGNAEAGKRREDDFLAALKSALEIENNKEVDKYDKSSDQGH